MVSSRILKGAGCLAIAGAVGVIVIYGGGDKEEICEDESPIGFYGDHKNHCLNIEDKIINDYTYHPYESSDSSESSPIFKNIKNGVKNISDVEDEFCTPYLNVLNQNSVEDTYTLDDVKKNNIFYSMAYAQYYGLTNYADLKEKDLKIPSIFDGGINCSVANSQIFIKESVGENENLIPTFNLNKTAKSINYFAIFASCNNGNMDVEFTFSLYKKESNDKYTRYKFIFDVNIGGNSVGIPSFFGGYFEDFIDENSNQFEPSNLEGCSIISVSYKIKENGLHPNTPLENEEKYKFGFLKLYEVLLPESTWYEKGLSN